MSKGSTQKCCSYKFHVVIQLNSIFALWLPFRLSIFFYLNIFTIVCPKSTLAYQGGSQYTSIYKYAHLTKCKLWRRHWNKRKYVPRIQLSFSKNEHQNEVVWLIHWKRAVKYQCSDFPRHATLDVPRPWFVLTRRKRRVRNTTLYDTSRFLTRRVPIQDSPSVVEYHGPVNSTKLLISRSVSATVSSKLVFSKQVNFAVEKIYFAKYLCNKA